jgi:hypothetical protein
MTRCQYKKYMLYSSIFILISTIISFVKKDTYKCIYYTALFLSTLNYWNHPVNGFRRFLDIFIVYFGVLFTISQLHLLKNELYIYLACSMVLCCIVFYIMEFICVYYNSNKWVIFHMCIHLYASLLVVFILLD